MEWDKIWAINRHKIDQVIPRYCAIQADALVKLTLVDGPAIPTIKQVNLHPKDASMGVKDVSCTKEVFLRREDCQVLNDGEEITLMSWGNIIVDKIEKKNDVVVSMTGHLNLEGNVKSTKYKLNWLPAIDSLMKITLRELDHLFTKPSFTDEEDPLDFVNPKSQQDFAAMAEPAMAALKVGDRLQLIRGAYYIVHQVNPMILIEIPDGKTKKTTEQPAVAAPVADAKGKADKKAPPAAAKAAPAKEKGAKKPAAAPVVERPLDDVARIDLRVGKITKVWPHPEADKLWCEEIQIGNDSPAVVCSGLREHYTQEEMQDRMVVVIANMKPRKMRGIESQAMVLCATSEAGKVDLLVPPAGAAIGERITIAGSAGEPDAVLNEKTGKAPLEVIRPFFTTDASRNATYKGTPFMTSAGAVVSSCNANSPIG